MLSFSTGDLLPVLHRLANDMLSSEGEQLVVRPIFIVPNGGHHAFSTPPRIHEDGSLQVTAAELRKAASSGADGRSDTLEFTADRLLPPVHRFGFGPITFAMGNSAVFTQIALLGPAADWGKSRPRITCSAFSAGMYRFTWHVVDFADHPVQDTRDGKVKVLELGLEIASLITRSFSSAELGLDVTGSATTDVKDVRHD
jgi:hypothetical protein